MILNKMNSKNINLIINSTIVILEIIGFILVFNELGITSLEYYTEDSNLLLLISSIIFIIYNSKTINCLHGLSLLGTLQLFQQH